MKNNKKIIVICGIVVFTIVVVAMIFTRFNNKNIRKNDTNVGNNKELKEEYTTLLKDVIKIGDYIQYEPIEEYFTITKDETGDSTDSKFNTSEYKGTWRAMYNDDENGLQIISATGVTSRLTLQGKFGYNNAVDTLNSFCNHYANNKDFAISGRCLGSDPISSKDNSETQEHFSAGALKVADENYKKDWDVINNNSLHSGGERTLLASRYTDQKSGLNNYYLRYITSSGDLENNSRILYSTATTPEIEAGIKKYYSMSTNNGYIVSGEFVRAIITLQQDVKVKGGDGTKDNPYLLAK